MRRRLGHAGTGALAIALLALAIRFTIRNRVPLIATFFYATPLPVIAALLVACAVLWSRKRSLAPLLGAALVIAWACWPRTHDPLIERSPTVRLVLWNVAHQGAATRTRDALATMNADAAVMVESGKIRGKALDAWDWPSEMAAGGFFVVAKTAILDKEALDLGDNARARRFRIGADDGLQIVAVDVSSNPLLSRRSALEALSKQVSTIEGPLVVLGDFNTPPESAWFDGLRTSFANAFETSGSGWSATWPVPLPVLHLDHVWTRDVKVVGARHGWVRGFDHRPVIVEIVPP